MLNLSSISIEQYGVCSRYNKEICEQQRKHLTPSMALREGNPRVTGGLYSQRVNNAVGIHKP